MIILYALCYGVAMKVADLLNEHGLKLFRGAPLLFGFAWATFGVLLIAANSTVANLVLAMNLAFLVRNRLDYLNHQVATTIIVVVFMLTSTLEPTLFLIFFFIFLAFGAIKDYIGDVLKKMKGTTAMLSEWMLYYPIPTFIYCAIYGNWIVFWVFLTYTVAYNTTKLVARQYGYR
jgi:predicted CDP-diglyceride synthetase/phosphatidate cytidylyltransferase